MDCGGAKRNAQQNYDFVVHVIQQNHDFMRRTIWKEKKNQPLDKGQYQLSLTLRDSMGQLGLNTNLTEKLNMGLFSPFKFERF